MAESDRIIIAGAGPVGLTAGLCLADRGVPVTVLEAGPALTIDLRAGSYHPPTLEMLAPYGITDRMHEDGIIVSRWQIRDRRDGVLAEFDLGLLKGDTPYPYRLHLEQHKLTPIILDAARKRSEFDIRFSSPVVDAAQDADGVTVTIDGPDGRHTERASYLIGADGHRSTVRRVMETEFEGFTWPELFLILSTPYDFEPAGFARASYIADPEEWVMLFKMPGSDAAALWRLAFPADPAVPNEELVSELAVQRRIGGFHAAGAPYEVIHRNAYRVHQRVAGSYYRGRIALAGDAAHVNNPLGGMGLNGGVHDAVNLADKLARLWHGEAGAEVLARYERQRRPVQIDYVQDITIRNKRLVEERDPAIRKKRQDEIRATGDDPAKAYEFLLDTSMISMIRKEATIA